MILKLKDLSFRRGQAMYEARRLSDLVHRSRRNMNILEQVAYGRAMGDVISLRDQIDAEIRTNRLTGHVNKEDRARGTDYEGTIRSFLLGNRGGRLDVVQERALTIGNEAQGGFLTVPETWGNAIISQVTDMVAVRRMATVYTVNSPTSFIAPSVEADFDDPDWTPEVSTIKDDTSFKTGRRELKPHALTKGVKISDKLMRSTAGLAETVVIDRLSYKRRIAEEKGFLTGDGNQKPLGVFTPSVQGVPTTRDVPVTLVSGGSLDATFLDSLIDAKYSMKAQYWRLMEWILHRDILKIVAKMKTGDGYYLYEASEDPNLPDMLLGRPINLSEYAPNTITSGGYLACLGDFTTGYAICDVVNQDIKILNELYIPDHQVGIIYHAEVDGMPVLGEAFARVKVV